MQFQLAKPSMLSNAGWSLVKVGFCFNVVVAAVTDPIGSNRASLMAHLQMSHIAEERGPPDLNVMMGLPGIIQNTCFEILARLDG
jgi:hypothetical protein